MGPKPKIGSFGPTIKCHTIFPLKISPEIQWDYACTNTGSPGPHMAPKGPICTCTVLATLEGAEGPFQVVAVGHQPSAGARKKGPEGPEFLVLNNVFDHNILSVNSQWKYNYFMCVRNFIVFRNKDCLPSNYRNQSSLAYFVLYSQ